MKPLTGNILALTTKVRVCKTLYAHVFRFQWMWKQPLPQRRHVFHASVGYVRLPMWRRLHRNYLWIRYSIYCVRGWHGENTHLFRV